MLFLFFLGISSLAVWTIVVLLKKDPRESEIKGVLQDMTSDAFKLFNNIGKLFNLLRESSNIETNSIPVTSVHESPNLIEISGENDKNVA